LLICSLYFSLFTSVLFCIISVFSFPYSFLCSPESWFPTCIYLHLSLLLNILLSVFLFSVYLFFITIFFSSLVRLSYHFLMIFP
jgi:hypothetical protein